MSGEEFDLNNDIDFGCQQIGARLIVQWVDAIRSGMFDEGGGFMDPSLIRRTFFADKKASVEEQLDDATTNLTTALLYLAASDWTDPDA